MLDIELFNKYYDFKFTNEEYYLGLDIGKKGEKLKGIGAGSKVPMYLSWGEKVEGETYDEKVISIKKLIADGKAYESTAKELYITLGNITEEEFSIKTFGYDLKTRKYFDAVFNNMGYLGDDNGYTEYEYTLIDKSNCYVNASDIEIGKLEDGRFIGTYSFRTDIDDYIIINNFFSKKPSIDDIKNLKIIDDMMFHFARNKDYKFKCYECGNKTHWLDAVLDGEKSLEDRFENLKNHYCGC